MYIHEIHQWPAFTWNKAVINELLATVRFHQGILLGKMSNMGFDMQETADLQIQTANIIKSSEIEGEKLNPQEVRSSIAKRLGLNVAGQINVKRSIDGIVEMHLDAIKDYEQPLTKQRLCAWHALLFPEGYSGMRKIQAGKFRTDAEGPMQVVSGGYGHETIHFQAPAADLLKSNIKDFLHWFNGKPNEDLLIMAAIAHLWFVTLHPFDDGNGRIARCIADIMLARSDKQHNRYYSMSTQIQLERKEYYDILEATQKGSLDITAWLLWFLNCLNRSIINADDALKFILNKAKFWEQHASQQLNHRQIKTINLLFDGFSGKLTSSKWAKINKCSQDTAARDIQDLINKHILIKSEEGGRSTNYILAKYQINVA